MPTFFKKAPNTFAVLIDLNHRPLDHHRGGTIPPPLFITGKIVGEKRVVSI